MKIKETILITLATVLLLCPVVSAQSGSVSGYERELIQRELESLVGRDKGDSVRISVNTAESYFVSNRENGVRGRATSTDRDGRRDDVWYDFVIDTRRGQLTKTDWGFNRSRDSRDNFPRTGSGAVRSGRYEIQLVATKRLLDIGSNGQVVQGDARRSVTQQWDFEDAGDGYYFIRSADTGEVMAVEGRGDNGSSVILERQRNQNAEAQLWEIRPGPDNGYYFVSRRNKAMDSPSSARQDGGRMQVYGFNGEANQRFMLRLISETRGNRGRGRNRNERDDRWDRGSAGQLTWRGRVDDVIELEIRGSQVYERVISGRDITGSQFRSGSPLPRQRVNVRVERLRGRGNVEVVEQPSSANGFLAVIRITDSRGGADDYEIAVTWD